MNEPSSAEMRSIYVPPSPANLTTWRLTVAVIDTDTGRSLHCLPGATLEPDRNGHPFRLCASIAARNYSEALSICDLVGQPEFYDGRATLVAMSDEGLEVRCVLEGCVFNHAITEHQTDCHFLVRECEALFVWHLLKPRAYWRVPLANFRVRIGDEFTSYLPPTDSGKIGGRVRDRIEFRAFGRKWVLRDPSTSDSLGKRHDIAPGPRLRGWLQTATLGNETRTDFLEQAEHICNALSLACGQKVYWSEIQETTDDGHMLARWSLARPQVSHLGIGFSPLDNHSICRLQPFLEIACPAIRKKSLWWEKSISWFTESRHTSIAELKATLLSILLDRIAAEMNDSAVGDEIGPDLRIRIEDEDWRQRLSDLLHELSVNWTSQRTQAVVGKIKEWNARPSYSGGIRRAFEKLGLPQPTAKSLGGRHKLLHLGEIGVAPEAVVDLCETLDWLAANLLFAMLGFRGHIFHAKFGGNVRIGEAR